MRTWLIGGLAAAVLSAPHPALGQESPTSGLSELSQEDQAAVRDALDALDAEMGRMAAGIGVRAPRVGAMGRTLLATLFRGLPDTRDYSFAIGFRLKTDTLEPGSGDEEPTDAEGCAADNPGRSVVRFERLSRDGASGYRCILTGAGAEAEEAAGLVSVMVLTGAERRLESRVAAALSADDAARAESILAGQRETLIKLSTTLDEMAAETLLGRE